MFVVEAQNQCAQEILRLHRRHQSLHLLAIGSPLVWSWQKGTKMSKRKTQNYGCPVKYIYGNELPRLILEGEHSANLPS